MNSETKGPMAEIEAIKKVAEALTELHDDAAITRVLRWAADRFGVTEVAMLPDKSSGNSGDDGTDGIQNNEFADVADLYAAANPKSDPDRALVVGYWLQFNEGMPEFDAQKLNSALKNMGHGVSNITSALTSLKARKPQLVMQTKKSGTSKQARKRYKLTLAGRNAVEAMFSGSV